MELNVGHISFDRMKFSPSCKGHVKFPASLFVNYRKFQILPSGISGANGCVTLFPTSTTIREILVHAVLQSTHANINGLQCNYHPTFIAVNLS